MSYSHISKTAQAKAFIEERERDRATAERIKRGDGRMEASRQWLAEHLAQPRRSSFDWAPRLTSKKPETINGDYSESYPLLEHRTDTGQKGQGD